VEVVAGVDLATSRSHTPSTLNGGRCAQCGRHGEIRAHYVTDNIFTSTKECLCTGGSRRVTVDKVGSKFGFDCVIKDGQHAVS
jgi:hypothetical protein